MDVNQAVTDAALAGSNLEVHLVCKTRLRHDLYDGYTCAVVLAKEIHMLTSSTTSIPVPITPLLLLELPPGPSTAAAMTRS